MRGVKSLLIRIGNQVTDLYHLLNLTESSRLVNSPSRRTRASVLDYQCQETRSMLAGIVFDAVAGEVLIGGTDQADRAVISQSGDSITVTQQGFGSGVFAASEVQRIVFVGLGGDDYFENQTNIRSFAYGQNGNDRLIGGSNDDHLIGNGGDDIITGNAGNDYLLAGNGNDQVSGNGGDDRFLGVRGFNQLNGGDGDDIIYGGIETDIITGGSGQNLLVGNDGDDQIFGGEDADTVFGGSGNDTIQGFGGDDQLYGQAGNDLVNGGSGADVVGGNTGNDTLVGEFGNDRILGGDGNDRSFHSGSFSDYRIDQVGPFVRFVGVSGNAVGGTDLEFSIEVYQFADDIRTPATIFDPARPTTPPGEGPGTPAVPPPPVNPTPPVNPAPPDSNILEVVTVQPIIVANSDGSNRAEFFGNAQQEADIKAHIDEIFAQARVDIEWLPAKTWNNTFVNLGNSNNRPGSDLSRIVSRGDAEGLGSSNRNVIDMYFVERVPGFGDVSEFTANGLAFVGAAGIAMQTGDRLVGFASGRDTVAHVAAHEIGHNLGLPHVDDPDNLLHASGGEDELTQDQINTILASPISQPV
jgi:hypothetical protein